MGILILCEKEMGWWFRAVLSLKQGFFIFLKIRKIKKKKKKKKKKTPTSNPGGGGLGGVDP